MNVFPKKLMLLGSGELGKEVAIAAKRLGCYVIACDRYNNAPAMQIADQFEVINMNNDSELKEVIYKCNPDIIIPEIEALAVDVLKEIEQKITVIPNARATAITSISGFMTDKMDSGKIQITLYKTTPPVTLR